MKQSILVDDERAICIAISRLLKARGYEVDTAQSAESAVEKLEQSVFHLVITDLSMGKMSGMDLLEWVKQHAPETAVIMITAYGSEKTAVEAMKLGASDYVPKPFDNDELELKVARVLETVAEKRENRFLREQVESTYRFENLIGKSPSMQRDFDVIRRVADSDLTVLVRGPSGTGKSTLIQRLRETSSLPLHHSVSATTRAPRPGEVNGSHYFFWTEEQFQEEVKRGGFLEWARAHNHPYGTLKREVEAARDRGEVVLLDVDVQGAEQIRRQESDLISVFVWTSTYEVLEQRLRDRGTDSDEAIRLRLRNARQEVERASEYQHVIINDDLDVAVSQLAALVEAQRQKSSQRPTQNREET